jgi:DNA-binding response OmpR family regulator
VASRPPEAESPARRQPGSVLLAEHEPEVAEMSARYLRRDGLRVRLVTSPELTLAGLTGGADAAAVIDLTMPGLDPRRIRRALRTPVIFLVADGTAPRPRGLAARGDAAGARRWLARPFSPRQLVALVRDVLADQQEPPGGPLADRRHGVLRLDGASRTAVAEGRHVPLTATEFAVLAVLLDHPGRVVSRRQLLTAAGRPAAERPAAGRPAVGRPAADRPAACDRAADVYVAQLRAKLGPSWPIRTVRGAGYALDR